MQNAILITMVSQKKDRVRERKKKWAMNIRESQSRGNADTGNFVDFAITYCGFSTILETQAAAYDPNQLRGHIFVPPAPIPSRVH